ncbi:MAG TPA: short-chain dehydrogenase [Gammaproteobacteria bacterium]|nr:short-chain dehydrogenase [Gammaproteobacteria bacterium]
MSEIKGTIAVTGASRGIGSAIVRNLASRGYQVACMSRKGQGIEDMTPSPQITEQLKNYACDVTEEQSIINALRAVRADSEKLVGLVNNAGIYIPGRSAHYTTEKFRQVFHTNVEAVFSACREIYPYLKTEGGGTIVNIGSFYDRLAVAYNTAYAASKAAVGSLTRSLAAEWASDHIRVLNVAPGYIATDLNKKERETEAFMTYLKTNIPVGRAGDPDEVAQLVGTLFDDNIGFLTGETLYIDGAQGTKLA